MAAIARATAGCFVSTTENRTPAFKARGDHRAAAVGRVTAYQDLAGSTRRARNPDRLAHHRRRTFTGTGLPGAQPNPCDRRRTMRGADRGRQRRQAPALHLPASDLGVPEAGALLAVPVDRTQQQVDVHIRPGLDAGQQPGPLDQANQVRPRHRRQPQAVAVGELPQELVQRRAGVDPAEQPRHAPERITSRSSMLSAPAAIPAMIEVSLPAG
jgi:hypothetical protein